MPPETHGVCRRIGLLAALAFVYFVVFPEDLVAVTAPVERLLSLSSAISPWLYLLLGFAVLAWTIGRIWGTKAPAPLDQAGHDGGPVS